MYIWMEIAGLLYYYQMFLEKNVLKTNRNFGVNKKNSRKPQNFSENWKKKGLGMKFAE